MSTWNTIKTEVAAMNAIQSKPTKIYLGILVFILEMVFFFEGYMAGKNSCYIKTEQEDK